MTPSATLADGRQATWSRENIIEALQEYVARYGEITQACLNPSSAKWADRQDLITRYYAGREDGTPWPSLNAVKKHLGKWGDAMVAADLPVNKPGPAPGTKPRAAGSVAPIRDVRVERVIVMSDRDKELSDKLAAARARSEQRGVEITRLQGRVRELQSRPARVTIPRAEPLVRTRTVTEQVKVADPRTERKLAKAEAKVTELRAEVKAAQKATEAEVRARAKAEVKMATARQELAQAREEGRSGASEVQAALARARAAEDLLAAGEARIERLREQVAKLEARGPVTTESEDVSTALAEAEARVNAAEVRAARAERIAAEHASALTGERRVLTRDELASARMRHKGPSGPAVVLDAVKAALKLRDTPGDGQLDQALSKLISAAVTWRDAVR